MHRAAQSVVPPSQNAFADLTRTDEDSTVEDGSPNSNDEDVGLSVACAWEDGDSQPLLDEITLLAALASHESPRAPTLDLIMVMLHMMQTTNQAVLARLDTIDDTNKSHRAALNDKADSLEIARLDQRLTEMTNNVRKDIAATFGAKIQSTLDVILDLRANLQHLMKKFNDSDLSWQRLAPVTCSPPTTVMRPTPDPVDPADVPTTPIVIDVMNGPELPTHGTHNDTTAPVQSTPPVCKTVDPTGVLGADIGYGP